MSWIPGGARATPMNAGQTLPSHADIVVYGSLDECFACEHFLGKSLDEAELLFRENWLYYHRSDAP